MNEEQVLNALACLTNGALNYYQATQTVMVRDNLIRNYIELLQKQNTELKEENKKIKETMQEYNDAGEYIYKLKDNWNKLKEGLRSLYDFDEGVVSKDYLECVEDTLDKMQEIEEKK